MRRTLLVLLISLSLPWSCWAISGKGTTAATFLKIGVGPRAVAMGESYAAIADDVSALYWNPAGLAQLTFPEITAMHVFWFEDIYFDYIAGAMPLAGGVLGGSLVYLNSGAIIRSEAGDTPDDPNRGTFNAADVGFTGGYAVQFSDKMYLGANLLLFSEAIDSQASFGFALDLGFLYELPWEGIRLGAVMQNLGPATRVDEEFFRLPINFKLGLSYRPWQEFLFSVDYNQLLEQEGKIGIGLEYTFEGITSLRVGYVYQGKVDNADLYSGYGTNAVAGLSAGMGVKYLDFRLDYAFVPYGFLGSAHRIAITYSFAGPQVTPTPLPTATPQPTPVPTPALQAQKRELEVKIKEIEQKIQKGILRNIEFKSGSAELTSASRETLYEVAAELMKYPGLKIRIEGHTDSQGSERNNLRLSQARTEAVKKFLVDEQGMLGENLIPVGYGESRPIASNKTADGRKKNRRVEFKVLDASE